ncbi:MAG: DUF3105 domain-containing protein [Polyangiaceae bacterium]|nr:DUF3105 domain-containing protein [Polyangiaceae bacterium]
MHLFRSLSASFAQHLVVVASVCITGCGEDVATVPSGPENVEVLTPGAPPLPGQTECRVVKTTNIALEVAAHVTTCTPVTYATNPPSGGNHWPTWAAFKKYTQRVPREMYVHAMEHGAVVLSYRCDDGCPDVVAALETVFDEAQGDPLCVMQGNGPKTRLVLTPDPDLDTPIAASAWGATYTATCIDTESLGTFISANYDKGPEKLCYPGEDIETTGGPKCD